METFKLWKRAKRQGSSDAIHKIPSLVRQCTSRLESLPPAMSSQRLIIVDDADSSVQYTGQGWFQDTGSRDGAGNFGPAYRHTLHGTKSDGSFSFPFHGEYILFFCGNHFARVLT